VYFAWKYIGIIFIYYFLKFIFDINTSKQSENTKKKIIWTKKNKIKIKTQFFQNKNFEKQKVFFFFGNIKEVYCLFLPQASV
jgi:predicted membrane protein